MLIRKTVFIADALQIIFVSRTLFIRGLNICFYFIYMVSQRLIRVVSLQKFQVVPTLQRNPIVYRLIVGKN